MPAISNLGSGGPMQRPAWAALIEPSPDYDNARVVIVDSQTYFDVLGRGPNRHEAPGLDRWNNEMSWLFNSPASEVRIKLDSQVYREVVHQGDAQQVAEQRQFINAYRQSGKIILDEGEVPHYATGRFALYNAVRESLKASGNLGKGDLLIASDAITNRLRIISHDVRFIDGLDKALRRAATRALLKSALLPNDIGKIFISPTRSAI